MRHVPSAYFPIFICCSPVNITGIFLSLQKTCHQGIYLETSVASRSRLCCPLNCCWGSALSLLNTPYACFSSTPLSLLEGRQASATALTGSCPGHSRDYTGLKMAPGGAGGFPCPPALGPKSSASAFQTECKESSVPEGAPFKHSTGPGASSKTGKKGWQLTRYVTATLLIPRQTHTWWNEDVPLEPTTQSARVLGVPPQGQFGREIWEAQPAPNPTVGRAGECVASILQLIFSLGSPVLSSGQQLDLPWA